MQSFVSYNTKIFEGTYVHYLGCCVTPHALTNLSTGVTIPPLPIASSLVKRRAGNDDAVDCEGASDV
jgi:hypothetical protein